MNAVPETSLASYSQLCITTKMGNDGLRQAHTRLNSEGHTGTRYVVNTNLMGNLLNGLPLGRNATYPLARNGLSCGPGPADGPRNVLRIYLCTSQDGPLIKGTTSTAGRAVKDRQGQQDLKLPAPWLKALKIEIVRLDIKRASYRSRPKPRSWFHAPFEAAKLP